MSPCLTQKVLLSEEPDSLETVTTSFPVILFLSTLTSQVVGLADVCLLSENGHVCLPCIQVCVCGYVFVVCSDRAAVSQSTSNIPSE